MWNRLSAGVATVGVGLRAGGHGHVAHAFTHFDARRPPGAQRLAGSTHRRSIDKLDKPEEPGPQCSWRTKTAIKSKLEYQNLNIKTRLPELFRGIDRTTGLPLSGLHRSSYILAKDLKFSDHIKSHIDGIKMRLASPWLGVQVLLKPLFMPAGIGTKSIISDG